MESETPDNQDLNTKKVKIEDLEVSKSSLMFYIFVISLFSTHMGFASFQINPLIETFK